MDALREFIVQELRRDARMLALLRAHVKPTVAGVNVDKVIDGWGGAPHQRTAAARFAARELPTLLDRYRGDRAAAIHVLYNMLDARFNAGHDAR